MDFLSLDTTAASPLLPTIFVCKVSGTFCWLTTLIDDSAPLIVLKAEIMSTILYFVCMLQDTGSFSNASLVENIPVLPEKLLYPPPKRGVLLPGQVRVPGQNFLGRRLGLVE